MASPPIPPLLGHLAARPFSFYPPILHIEHNEWIFRKATWSELLVVNHKTGAELSIPRHFIGEVSLIDHPVVIVDSTANWSTKTASCLALPAARYRNARSGRRLGAATDRAGSGWW